jgi:choline dehydrogenase
VSAIVAPYSRSLRRQAIGEDDVASTGAAAAYDIVIAGGGAAGCVLAARLTEDPAIRVLLLEAGPDYVEMPAGLTDGLGHPHTETHNWGLTSEPDGTGRVLDLPRGRVIGGSSTTNAAFAIRGSPADYDSWAAAGHDGWSWRDVLPYFVKLENDLDFGQEPYHGNDGPIPIRRYAGDARSELAAVLHDAIAATGVPEVADHNAPGAVGVGPMPVNEVSGRRMGAATTYLSAARSRPNLAVRGDALVDRVVVQAGRAVGLQLHGGETVPAGHVVLCGGTYGSPAILLRSGIGPERDLRAMGIDLTVPLEGVGHGLVDHCAVSIDLAYNGEVRPVRLFQVVATASSEVAPGPAPDLQIFNVGPFRVGDEGIWVLVGAVVKPQSRGRLWLRSPDPVDPPHIDLGYYADPEDMRRHVEVLRRVHAVVNAPDVRALTSSVLAGPDSDHDEDLERHIRANMWSYHHPVGTCAMGTVVDASGAVQGVDGLSVVDASIMPDIPSANTHLPTVMIAERLAEVLRAANR